jgi:hypothetical protein
MLIFVSSADAENCLAALQKNGEPAAWIAGKLTVRDDDPAVEFVSMDSWPTAS